MFVESMFFGTKCLHALIALEFFTPLVVSWMMFQTFQHTGFWSRLYRSWDYLENYGIYSQLDRKSITRYFAFLNVYISRIENEPKFWPHSFHLQNSAILQTRVKQKGGPMKMSFNDFHLQQLISEIVRAQKVVQKRWVISLVSFFWFLSYSP